MALNDNAIDDEALNDQNPRVLITAAFDSLQPDDSGIQRQYFVIDTTQLINVSDFPHHIDLLTRLEALNLLDIAIACRVHPRNILDTTIVIDIVSDYYVRGRVVQDSISPVIDLYAKNLFYNRSLTDPIASIIDIISDWRVLNRSFVDPITLTDIVTRQMWLTRSPAEVLSITESIIQVLITGHTQLRAVIDALSVTDNFIEQRWFTRAPLEVLSAMDVSGTSRSLIRALTDTLTATDASIQLMKLTRAVINAISMVDQSGTSILRNRALLESVAAVIDALSKSLVFNRSAIEPINVAEVLAKSFDFGRAVLDSMVLIDNVIQRKWLTRLLLEALNAVDAYVAKYISAIAPSAVQIELDADDHIQVGASFNGLPTISSEQNIQLGSVH